MPPRRAQPRSASRAAPTGTAHAFARLTPPLAPSLPAAAGVLCAESSLAGLLVLLGWLRGDSGLAVLAAVPAAFSAWGIAELAAAKAADTVTAAPMKTRAKKA